MNTTVVIKPVITEKSLTDAKNGKFTFIVAKNSTKTDIKKAVADQFKVKVIAIATVMVKGKTKRVGKRRAEKVLSPIKKAIVELEKGQKIDLFDVGNK